MEILEYLAKHQAKDVVEYPNRVLAAMPKPLVSCRISTYQHVNYIRTCIESVLNQLTDFDFEIIIGEDESNDGTREICLEYAQAHPDKIRLFLHSRENNILIDGKPSAKFQGMYSTAMCRGKFIAVCEGDDYWTDIYKLQKQVDFLKKHEQEVAICAHAVYELNEATGSQIRRPALDQTKYYHAKELISGNFLHTCSIVYRADFSINYYPSWYYNLLFGDWASALILLHLSGKKAAMLPDTMSVYRIVESGMHGNARNSPEKLYKAYRMHLHFIKVLQKNLLHDKQYVKPIVEKHISTYEQLVNLKGAVSPLQHLGDRLTLKLLRWKYRFLS